MKIVLVGLVISPPETGWKSEVKNFLVHGAKVRLISEFGSSISEFLIESSFSKRLNLFFLTTVFRFKDRNRYRFCRSRYDG
jgi:hypothetical protein